MSEEQNDNQRKGWKPKVGGLFDFVERHQKTILLVETAVIVGAILAPKVRIEIGRYRQMQEDLAVIREDIAGTRVAAFAILGNMANSDMGVDDAINSVSNEE